MVVDRLPVSFLRTLAIFSLLLALAVMPGNAQPAGCEYALELAAEDESFLQLGKTEQEAWVRVDVPAAGFLRVAVRGADEDSRPLIGLWGEDCQPVGTANVRMLERQSERLTLRAESAGSLMFRISSEDPQYGLDLLTVSSRFVGDTGQPYESLAAPGGEDEEEIEIDPSTLVEEWEPSGGLDLSCEGSHAAKLDVPWNELCADAYGTDDHGDDPRCSTPLHSASVGGEIENGSGRDVDVFRIELPGTAENVRWRVVAQSVGDLDTTGSLLDHRGHLLAAEGGGGMDENFRFARSLAPGIYFLRVEGSRGAEGRYGLEVSAAPW